MHSTQSYARAAALQAVFSGMQLTLRATRRTPHGASRLVLAMSAWSVKTRRALSWHCRDARVYGHTTTAMHDIEYIYKEERDVFRGDEYSRLWHEEVQYTR